MKTAHQQFNNNQTAGFPRTSTAHQRANEGVNLKSFKYLKYEFTPYSTKDPLLFMSDKSISEFKIAGYSYIEFYEKAKGVGAGNFNVFECNGSFLIPCETRLIEVKK